MPKKIRIDAPSLDGLRGFLSRADVDMGCRPHVTKRENRFYAVAIAEDAEIARMNTRVADDVHVDPTKPKVLSFCIKCGHEFQPEFTAAQGVFEEVGAALVAFAADVSAPPSA